MSSRKLAKAMEKQPEPPPISNTFLTSLKSTVLVMPTAAAME
jgi:hypothetical protein